MSTAEYTDEDSLKGSNTQSGPTAKPDQNVGGEINVEFNDNAQYASEKIDSNQVEDAESTFEAKIQETIERLHKLPSDASEIQLPEVKLSITNVYTKLCHALNVPISSTFLSQGDSEIMDFSYQCLGPIGIIPLAKALIPCTTVKKLNLSYNKLEVKSLPAITLLVDRNDSIMDLNLSNNEIGKNSALQMGKLISAASTVEVLDLSGNDIGDGEITEIGTALINTDKIKELDLSKNNIGSVSGPPLGMSIAKCNALEKLDLSFNHLEDGVIGLFDGLKKSNLKTLKLNKNGIADASMAALEAGLRRNKSLQELDLIANYITNKGIKILSTGVKKSTTLQILKLAHNPLEGNAVNTLLASAGPSLKHLDLTGVKSNAAFMKTLRKFAKSGKDIKVLYGAEFRRDCLPQDYNLPTDNTVTDSNALEVLQKMSDEKGVSLNKVLKSIHASFLIQKTELDQEEKDDEKDEKAEGEKKSEVRLMTTDEFAKALASSQMSVPKALSKDIAKACSVDGNVNMWELILNVKWRPDEMVVKSKKKELEEDEKDKKKGDKSKKKK